MITRRRFAAQAAASALAPGLMGHAALAQPSLAPPAQNWPARFVRVVVPYASGGPTDSVVRTVADPLARAWGQQVVIENKGGAGTNIGAEAVARSDPDGYTLLVGSSALAMNRNLYRSLNYDAVVDFAPVTLICSFPFFMCIPNSSPAKSVQEFIAYAKEKRGTLTFATPGPGTPPHMAGELFKRMAGIEMTHVPYRGAGASYADLIAGRIDLQFASGVALELIKSGQVRGLAISSAKRNAAAPDGAHRRRGRRSGLRSIVLVRLLRAGENAARHHQEDQRRHGRGPRRSGGQVTARRARLYGDRLDPRGARNPSPVRDQQMGPGDQGRGHPGRWMS